MQLDSIAESSYGSFLQYYQTALSNHPSISLLSTIHLATLITVHCKNADNLFISKYFSTKFLTRCHCSIFHKTQYTNSQNIDYVTHQTVNKQKNKMSRGIRTMARNKLSCDKLHVENRCISKKQKNVSDLYLRKGVAVGLVETGSSI